MLIRFFIYILYIGLVFQTIDRDDYLTSSPEWALCADIDIEHEETGNEELMNIFFPDYFQWQADFWPFLKTHELTDIEYFYPSGYCIICLEPPKHFT